MRKDDWELQSKCRNAVRLALEAVNTAPGRDRDSLIAQAKNKVTAAINYCKRSHFKTMAAEELERLNQWKQRLEY